MKFYSVAKKIYNIISAKFRGKNNFIPPNLYLYNLDVAKLRDVKSVLFCLNNSEYMHLGDHLFFMPLIKAFIDSGYEVEVTTTHPMYETFKLLNLHVTKSSKPYDQYDIVISRFELIRRLKATRSLLLHVSQNISKPICEHLLYELGKYFNLEPYVKPDLSIFYDKDILNKFNLPANKKLVFFSLYCDASSYLITQTKRDILLDFVKRYTTEDYLIVLVGSDKEKINDKQQYDFPHIDLRGLTSVLDIFKLVAMDNSKYYIGFDAFIMHVFSLFKKQSYVVFRGRITKKQNDMLKKYHIKLFSQDNYVTLLN